MYRAWILALVVSWNLSSGALAENATPAIEPPDAAPGLPFREGDVVNFDGVDALRDYLPAKFWENRDYFFFEGMRLEIGPSFRQYGESTAYRNVTDENRGKAAVGPGGALVGYSGGLPFPTDQIDCQADPLAGNRIIWNFTKAWNGDGAMARFRYTFWDRGEQIPIHYEGTTKIVNLKDRVEPQYRTDAASPGDIFENEKRLQVTGIELDNEEALAFRGGAYRLLTYRYDSADGERDSARRDDLWVYVPHLKQVRKWIHKRAEVVSNADYSFDDMRSFSGMPPQYDWTCLGEKEVLAPFNTKHLAYPYRDDYDFGPYGTSYANDRWELREAWVIRMNPKRDLHPYHHKDIYIDKETYEPLYSFGYDRKGQLWKVIWHNHRYSEDWDGTTPERTDTLAEDGVWYRGWEGVDKPMDLRTVSDIVVNVRNGMANRSEYWDSHGMPFPNERKLRHYISVGRLGR
jgi:hypothetical protein